jgi:CHAT domain-containing protein
VVVAGPGLPGAGAEAAAVAALYGTGALTGTGATVEHVLKMLAGSDVAHLATHGTISRDHPLFSALMLADGPLTGYDLERLQPVPGLVVLAGCDTGRNTVRAGDELLGLTATLLERGAQQVVASVVAVPDAATALLMTALHRGLIAGGTAAQALAAAQAQVVGDGRDDGALAAAAGFVCLGGTFRLPHRVSEPG